MKILKEIRHFLEFILIYFLFTLFKILPVRLSSFFLKTITQPVFAWHKVNDVILSNLERVFPKKTLRERKKLRKKIWENSAVSLAEFPFYCNISKEKFYKHVEVSGYEHIQKAVDSKHGYIMFSAHFSNWEVIYAMFRLEELKGNLFYRPNSNKFLENYTIKMRNNKNFPLIAKGNKGVKKALITLKKGNMLASFIDQKYNEGISVPFLGHEAMTPPLIANLHLNYGYKLIPIHAERVSSNKYRIIIEEPLQYEKSGDSEKDVYNIMKIVNSYLEKWILKNPEQWFWFHKRWPK